jgi:hypothetical protein
MFSMMMHSSEAGSSSSSEYGDDRSFEDQEAWTQSSELSLVEEWQQDVYREKGESVGHLNHSLVEDDEEQPAIEELDQDGGTQEESKGEENDEL